MATKAVKWTEARTADGDGTKVAGRGRCVVKVTVTSGSGTFSVNEDDNGATRAVDDAGTALTATANREWVLEYPASDFNTVWVTVSSASSLVANVSIAFDGEPPLQ